MTNLLIASGIVCNHSGNGSTLTLNKTYAQTSMFSDLNHKLILINEYKCKQKQSLFYPEIFQVSHFLSGPCH